MLLAARALVAFLVLPGVVAFLAPWLLLGRRLPPQPFAPPALLPLLAGLALLLWCVAAFYRVGRGTLAPWDPPRHLVAVGAYRVSRNPMYLGVMLILAGWALGFRSRPLALYALAVMVGFHLRVVLGEEPFLARTHGEQWTAYAARVPRWLGLPRGNAGGEAGSD